MTPPPGPPAAPISPRKTLESIAHTLLPCPTPSSSGCPHPPLAPPPLQPPSSTPSPLSNGNRTVAGPTRAVRTSATAMCSELLEGTRPCLSASCLWLQEHLLFYLCTLQGATPWVIHLLSTIVGRSEAGVCERATMFEDTSRRQKDTGTCCAHILEATRARHIPSQRFTSLCPPDERHWLILSHNPLTTPPPPPQPWHEHRRSFCLCTRTCLLQHTAAASRVVAITRTRAPPPPPSHAELVFFQPC